jgi:hypothetical protein
MKGALALGTAGLPRLDGELGVDAREEAEKGGILQ